LRRSIETKQARSASLDSDVSAETSSRTPQQQRIEAQRAQLLQAHGVLRCLYEVLLHAECDDAVFYAEAAHVAATREGGTVAEQLRVAQRVWVKFRDENRRTDR
jgi:uncharacterized protein YecT (DUF1311 family)